MSSYLDAIKPGCDDSQLNNQLDSQLDSQLTVARGPSRSAPPQNSTVLKLPPNLTSIRHQAFALNAQIIWTAADYALY